MKVKVSMGGQIKAIEEVLSTVPLSEVDSIEVKRFGLAGVMEIRLGEASFKLEGKVNDLREFAGCVRDREGGRLSPTRVRTRTVAWLCSIHRSRDRHASIGEASP